MNIDLIDLVIEIANSTMGYHRGNLEYGCKFCGRMYLKIRNDTFPKIGDDSELSFHDENCPGLQSIKIARKYCVVKNVAEYPKTQTVLRYVRTKNSHKKLINI